MGESLFYRLAKWTAFLAFVVVVLGAYTRLSDAGLGCPDWPGCYGQITVPREATSLDAEAELHATRPLEPEKAWKEMVHRYFAGALGLMIVILAVVAWRNRREPTQPLGLPLFLVLLVIFQALLGMWTVTLLLKPVVVMAHLLGGLTTFALLVWLALRTGPVRPMREARSLSHLRSWTIMAIVIVVIQIALGGWTSANYAALACGSDFPTCLGEWWPEMDFSEAFVLWRGIGVDYEYGVLDNEARAAIQMTHRIGFVVTFLFVGWLSLRLITNGRSRVARNIGLLIGVLLLLQVGLGIANVLLNLPLAVATAHNAGAALLLASLVLLNHSLRPKSR